MRYSPLGIVGISFILLALSGLALFHPAFWPLTQIFGGGVWTRILYPYLGVLMGFAFILMMNTKNAKDYFSLCPLRLCGSNCPIRLLPPHRRRTSGLWRHTTESGLRMTLPTFLTLCWLLLTAAPLAAQDCRDEYPASIPNSRFIVNQDGTVRDQSTGLMWKQCAEGLSGVGCVVGTPLTFKWKWAMRQGQDNRFAGYADWRLPTQTELLSLIQRRCYGLDIDVANFPNTPPASFWTATPTTYYGGDAWTIHFGTSATSYGTKRDSAHVRLVRDSAACSPARPGSCIAHEAKVPLPADIKPQPTSPFLP